MQLDTEKVLMLEQSFLKVPFEALRRNLRSSQRMMERDMAACQSSLAELAKKGVSDPAQLQGVLGRLKGVKRKISELEGANEILLENTASRVAHLNKLHSISSFADTAYPPWARDRLTRHLVDYLIRHDPPLFESAAELVATEDDARRYVDCELELFEDCIRIERSLAEHKVSEALSWCRENASGLKRLKSTLEFDLRHQELIELARAGKHEQAIAHCRKHLVPWNESHSAEIRSALTLLAFPVDTRCRPYALLYDIKRWEQLRITFRVALFNLHSLPPLPLISLSLHTGLASLKLHACYSPAAKGDRNADCPICDDNPTSGLGALAASNIVPFAHHVNSTMVCKISGKIMDTEPMALPNGRVYSREALETLALKNDGVVMCPRTAEAFDFASLRKVYIS